MKVSFVLLLSLFAISFADVCLQSVNPVGEGSPCSSTTRCSYGLYCATGKGSDGKCHKILKAGESCKDDDECEMNFSCNGPTDNKICVKNANPGEACSTSSDSSVARCLTGCDPVTTKCTNGNVGDLCTDAKDCLSPLTCDVTEGSKDKVCIALSDGSNCTTNIQCKPTSYCTLTERKCTPRKTSGECTSANECAYGYICTRKSASDQPQCIAQETFVAGSYCETDSACESNRCYGGFCATKSAVRCTSSDDCSSKETCRCSGDILSDGFGTCVGNPCVKPDLSYNECVIEKCHTNVAMAYDNSCAYNNCKSKYISATKCNSAGTIFASAVTILFALLAVALVF